MLTLERNMWPEIRATRSLFAETNKQIPSCYSFAFRHPARGGSMSSTGSPPFSFSRATKQEHLNAFA
jgi:hypothetical protein